MKEENKKRTSSTKVSKIKESPEKEEIVIRPKEIIDPSLNRYNPGGIKLK